MPHLSKPNLERAKRAKEALTAYADAVYGVENNELDDTMIIDFLADLMHLCDLRDVDCAGLFEEAQGHHSNEKEINKSVLCLEHKKSREALACGCEIVSSEDKLAFTACPTHQTVLGEQASHRCLQGNKEEDRAPCGCALIWHEDGIFFAPCVQHGNSYQSQDTPGRNCASVGCEM